LLVLRTGYSVFTTSMRMRYVSPMFVDTDYRCVASTTVTMGQPGPYSAQAEILDLAGNALVYASASYQPMSAADARQRMSITDADADHIERELANLRDAQGGN
jgi:hypothetical protein